jgi:hypothetical protein
VASLGEDNCSPQTLVSVGGWQFDNGTSLGYELEESKLGEFSSPGRLASYVARGTHHCSWTPSLKKGTNHIDLCRSFVEAYPESGEAMRSVIQLDLAEVRPFLEQLHTIPSSVPFTRERVELVLNLLRERKRRLEAALGE